ncbi:MAG: hypothetical protein R3Y12_08635 [Clostridia bacterium]
MKKYLKIGAILLAFAIIAFVLSFGNSLTGNPVSKNLANKNAKVYIKENYADYDLIIDDAFYDFKMVNSYVISVKSETIEDLYFSVYYDMLGNLIRDNYENLIIGGQNTMYRLNMEYMSECKNIFATLENSDMFKDCESFFASGWLWETEQIDNLSNTFKMEFTGGIETNTLQLDKNYDMSELGEVAGVLDVSVRFLDKDTSFERGAEALREIKQVFEEQNLKFKYITFGVFNEEGNFAWDAPYFSYDDIESEDLVEILYEYSKKSIER